MADRHGVPWWRHLLGLHRRPRDASGRPVPGWQGWKHVVGKPLRRSIVLVAMALVAEYLVVPELLGAGKNLYLLGRLRVGWAVASLVLEGLSLFCYGLLTRSLLPADNRPGIFTLFRIDLSAAAVGHVIPAGTLGAAGIGYRLFTAEGITPVDTGVMMASKGLGSTLVLNVLLWVSLVVSIPLAGFHPIYVTVAVLGALILLVVTVLVVGITRGTERVSRLMGALGRRIPKVENRLERAVLQAADSLRALGRDRRTLVAATFWATANWLLDAAALWCFVAAFGTFVDPFELFAAYGIANVAGAVPITPAGLGVVDSIAPLLLVSFGVNRNVATLGVLGWRLVNFWLPIPVGALAYASLKIPGALEGLGSGSGDQLGRGSRPDPAAEEDAGDANDPPP